MQTEVSIPDDLFEKAEELTHWMKKSRSELYADAIREYLERHREDAITEQLNRALEGLDSSLEPDLKAANLRTLERVEWN
jgi:metal-responsive CopG/Arc/MetJ family transcriptional regulator